MDINNMFEIGQIVYLVTDPNQSERIVFQIIVREGGYLMYDLSHGHENSTHYGFEITEDENTLKKVK